MARPRREAADAAPVALPPGVGAAERHHARLLLAARPRRRADARRTRYGGDALGGGAEHQARPLRPSCGSSPRPTTSRWCGKTRAPAASPARSGPSDRSACSPPRRRRARRSRCRGGFGARALLARRVGGGRRRARHHTVVGAASAKRCSSASDACRVVNFVVRRAASGSPRRRAPCDRVPEPLGLGRRGRHWADAVAELHLREHAHDGEPVESGEIRCPRLVFIDAKRRIGAMCISPISADGGAPPIFPRLVTAIAARSTPRTRRRCLPPRERRGARSVSVLASSMVASTRAEVASPPRSMDAGPPPGDRRPRLARPRRPPRAEDPSTARLTGDTFRALASPGAVAAGARRRGRPTPGHQRRGPPRRIYKIKRDERASAYAEEPLAERDVITAPEVASLAPPPSATILPSGKYRARRDCVKSRRAARLNGRQKNATRFPPPRRLWPASPRRSARAARAAA